MFLCETKGVKVMDDEELAYLPDIYHECIENQTEKIFKSITKGGEKVRPYLEVKVVKVKKEKEQKYCPCCGGKVEMEKLEGEWVNEENLDKIKFPCYCTFDANKGMLGDPNRSYKVKGIGRIDLNYTESQRQYQLSWADHQENDLSVLCSTPSFKRLIEIYNIHIRKVKLILFEEE